MNPIIHCAGVFALTAAAVATAAPPIVYARIVAGNANEAWLVQPDGTGTVRVYRGPSKM